MNTHHFEMCDSTISCRGSILYLLFLLLMCVAPWFYAWYLLPVVLGTITKIMRSTHELRNSLYMSVPAKSFLICFVFIFYFKLEDNYFKTIVTVFAMDQHGSALGVHRSPSSGTSLPLSSCLSHPSRESQSMTTGSYAGELPLSLSISYDNVHAF